MTFPRWIRSTARALALAVVVISGIFVALQTSPGRSLTASLIESAASSDGRIVKIEGLEGRIPDDLRIAAISVSDAKGVWLKAERTHLSWSPFALISGEIAVKDLDIDRIDWLRNPLRAPASATRKSSDGNRIPALAVDRIAIASLAVDGAVAGTPATFAIDGALDMRDPASRATLKFVLTEERGATADLAATYSAADARLDLRSKINDAADGTLAAMLGVPKDAPLAIDLQSTGPLDAWQAQLTATGGTALSALGHATIKRKGAWRELALTLDADIQDFGPSSLNALLNGHTNVTVTAARSDDGAIRIDRLIVASPALSATANGAVDSARSKASGQASLTIPNGTPFAPLLGEGIAWRDLVINASIEDAGATPILAVEANAAEIAGTPAALKLRGNVENLNALKEATATLTARGLTAAFKGDATADTVKGLLSIEAPDLKQQGLKAGSISLEATVNADITATTFVAEGKATAHDLGVDGAIDGLLTGDSALTYSLSGSANEVRVARLSLDNANLSLRAKGTLASNALDANSTISVPDIAAIAPEHAGRAEIEIHATGTPNAPRVAATARVQSGRISAAM